MAWQICARIYCSTIKYRPDCLSVLARILCPHGLGGRFSAAPENIKITRPEAPRASAVKSRLLLSWLAQIKNSKNRG
jgi:hypothetical protein